LRELGLTSCVRRPVGSTKQKCQTLDSQPSLRWRLGPQARIRRQAPLRWFSLSLSWIRELSTVCSTRASVAHCFDMGLAWVYQQKRSRRSECRGDELCFKNAAVSFHRVKTPSPPPPNRKLQSRTEIHWIHSAGMPSRARTIAFVGRRPNLSGTVAPSFDFVPVRHIWYPGWRSEGAAQFAGYERTRHQAVRAA
jgi:hypothetical protein